MSEVMNFDDLEEGSAFAVLRSPDAFFSSAQYWEERYQRESRLKQQEAPNEKTTPLVEWYFPYSIFQNHALIKPILETFRKQSCAVLDIGCGNSAVALDMVDDGFSNIVGIDFSPFVIQSMKQGFDKTGIQFLVMDARKLEFITNHFEIVVDKGTLDAVVFCDDPETSAKQMLTEVSRVMKPGGYYILITSKKRLKLLKHKEYCWNIEKDTVKNSAGVLIQLYVMQRLSDNSQIDGDKWNLLQELDDDL